MYPRRVGFIGAGAALVFLVVLLFHLAPMTGRAQDKAAAAAGASWQLVPMVRIGDPVPDKAGARFEGFGESWWLETGVLVFWGRSGKQGQDWALYSWKDGAVKTILPDGDDVTSPNFEPRPGVRPQKIRLHRAGHLPRFTTPLHRRTQVHAGKRLFYISSDTAVNIGPRDHENSTVYAWDGERLRQVLGRDESLTVGAAAWQLDSAGVLAVSTDDKALIGYRTKAPRETSGWVLYDGASLTPVLAAGDALPGMPGLRIANATIVLQPPVQRATPYAAAWRSPDVTMALLEVSGAPYKRAVFRLTPDKSEKIVAEGDVDPADAKKKIKDIRRIVAGGPDTVAILAGTSSWTGESCWLLYHRGALRRLFDASQLRVKPRPGDWAEMGRLTFLQVDPPRVVVEATVTSSVKGPATVGSYEAARADYYLCDGERVTRLEMREYPAAVRLTSGDRPGALIGGLSFAGLRELIADVPNMEKKLADALNALLSDSVSSEVALQAHSGFGVSRLSPRADMTAVELMQDLASEAPVPRKYLTHWFLEVASQDGRLQAPAEIARVGDRTLTLADLVAWRTPGDGVVELADGFYGLARVGST